MLFLPTNVDAWIEINFYLRIKRGKKFYFCPRISLRGHFCRRNVRKRGQKISPRPSAHAKKRRQKFYPLIFEDLPTFLCVGKDQNSTNASYIDIWVLASIWNVLLPWLIMAHYVTVRILGELRYYTGIYWNTLVTLIMTTVR